MSQEYYLIKEAAARVGVESHVLRYWEEELKMDIHRNAMGHRYYTEKDIGILSKVKDLKERGLQLRAIRNYLDKRRQQMTDGTNDSKPDVIRVVAEDEPLQAHVEETIVPVKQHTMTTSEEKMEQFQQIMTRVLANAIKENNELIGKTAGEHAANAVVTQMQGMTKEQEERAEERYRKLDQTLREIQRARAEAAATSMRPIDKRKQKRIKRKTVQVKQPSMEAESVDNVQEEADSKEEI
ncbi:MAG: helix-turn-helix domain-containing protein [Clostridium sp.]|nr:helix-turn-helix domain-containing protein [Clostridium sp.]